MMHRVKVRVVMEGYLAVNGTPEKIKAMSPHDLIRGTNFLSRAELRDYMIEVDRPGSWEPSDATVLPIGKPGA